MSKTQPYNEQKARENRRLRDQLYIKAGKRCYICNYPVRDIDGNVEHDIPKSEPGAGRNEPYNLNFVCFACNTCKQTQNILQFVVDQLESGSPYPHLDKDRLSYLRNHHFNPGYTSDLLASVDRNYDIELQEYREGRRVQ